MKLRKGQQLKSELFSGRFRCENFVKHLFTYVAGLGSNWCHLQAPHFYFVLVLGSTLNMRDIFYRQVNQKSFSVFLSASRVRHLCFLVDPGSAVALVVDDLTLLEPESDLLLGVLDAVGTVANVAADLWKIPC